MKTTSNSYENEEKHRKHPKAQSGVYEVSYLGDRFISVDDYICDSLGYSRDELLSTNPLELLDDESLNAFAELLLTEEQHEAKDYSATYHVKAKNGVVKTFIAKLVEFRYTDGFPSSAIVSATDVTEEEKSS